MNAFSTVMLIVSIVTGPDKQNLVAKVSMPDMETCFAEVKEFMNHKWPEITDPKGLRAMCDGVLIPEEPS